MAKSEFQIRYNKRDIDRLRRRIKDVDKNTRSNLRRALFQEGLDIARVSRERTPVLTGALRASTEVERPVEGTDTIEVRIKVGGPAASYAVYVHYDLLAFHKVGGPLFLESAMNDARRGMTERIVARAGG